MACLLASFSFFFFVRFTPPSTSLLFPADALPTLPSCSLLRSLYAFYEAQQPPSSSLNGGSGCCSSLFGNWLELVPWRATSATSLRHNSASWNHRFGLLFADSPSGWFQHRRRRERDPSRRNCCHRPLFHGHPALPLAVWILLPIASAVHHRRVLHRKPFATGLDEGEFARRGDS